MSGWMLGILNWQQKSNIYESSVQFNLEFYITQKNWIRRGESKFSSSTSLSAWKNWYQLWLCFPPVCITFDNRIDKKGLSNIVWINKVKKIEVYFKEEKGGKKIRDERRISKWQESRFFQTVLTCLPSMNKEFILYTLNV